MRIALTLLCVIVVLFAGYWVLNATVVMAALFAVIAGLNILLLADLHLRPGLFRGFYKLLSALDGFAASALTVIVMLQARQGEAVDLAMIAAIAVLVVKAILTQWLLRYPETV